MAAGAEHECDNWEIRVTTPAPELLEPGAGDTARLSPRGGGGGAGGGEVIDTDECWTINIKSPASLNIDTGSPDQDGFAVDTLIQRIFFIAFIYYGFCGNKFFC